jgi:lysophospholipase L1-like esterase
MKYSRKRLRQTGMIIAAVALCAWLAGSARAAEPNWEKQIQAFEAADKTNPPPQGAVVFVGSSSIRLWTTLAQDFTEFPVVNRGFGGSQIADSVRYAERIVIAYKPKIVVLYAGGNDLTVGKTPAQVAADFEEFVTKVRAALPDTWIVYISVNPSKARWNQLDATQELNRRVAESVQGKPRLAFIDTHSKLLGPDGKYRDDLLRDGLHLNAKGYELWCAIIKPELLALWKQFPSRP